MRNQKYIIISVLLFIDQIHYLLQKLDKVFSKFFEFIIVRNIALFIFYLGDYLRDCYG